MNLICCTLPCVHQKEGICTLSPSLPVIGAKVEGCCYFLPEKQE